MVNTGRPSTGCKRCKSRRVKCDEARPGCNRCKVFDQSCPGYDTVPKFRFRYHTPTAQGLKASDPKKQVASKRLSGIRPTAASALATSSPSLSPGYGLATQEEDVALALFFGHFVPTARFTDHKDLYLGDLVDYYVTAPISSPLRQITSAIAFSVLARALNRPHLLNCAMMKYGQALRSMAVLLSKSTQTTSANITLLSAMLLAFYEMMTNTKESVRTYQNHLDAVARLLMQRKKLDVRDPLTLMIFRRIRASLCHSRMWSGTSISRLWFPDAPSQLSDPVLNPSATPDHLALRIATLRKRAKDLSTVTSEHRVQKLLADAYSLDQETVSALAARVKRLSLENPIALPVRSVHPEEATKSPQRYWNNTVDIYHLPFDVDVKALIHFRLNRIFIQAVIIKALTWLAGSKQALNSDFRYLEACRTCQTLADDICSSAPNYIRDPRDFDDPKELDQTLRIKKVENSMAAVCFMWPCATVSTLEVIPSEQRHWLKRQLSIVADTYSCAQAQELTNMEPSLIYGPDTQAQILRHGLKARSIAITSLR